MQLFGIVNPNLSDYLTKIVFEFLGQGHSGDGSWFVMQVLFLTEEEINKTKQKTQTIKYLLFR